jgi:hypothetical protein
MPNLEHIRWHLALALGGALLIERFHGSLAVGLIALVAIDRAASAAYGWVRRPKLQQEQMHRATTTPKGRPSDHRARLLPRTGAGRHTITLTRALHADCESCRGFGCRTCAYTGLG